MGGGRESKSEGRAPGGGGLREIPQPLVGQHPNPASQMSGQAIIGKDDGPMVVH